MKGHVAFAMRAAGTYGAGFIMDDSSADYWKLTAEGELIFDGRKGVYDENDELLREFEGQGGYAASLAEHLGITKSEANQMMIDAGWTYGNRTFTTDGGATDVRNNADHTLDPGVEFASRYFMQRDYIDRVGEFGGSMVAAVTAAQEGAEADFMTALRNGTMTPEIVVSYQTAEAMQGFAEQYDAALYGQRYGSFGVPGLLNRDAAADYDQATIAEANQQIKDNWSQTDDNPLYSFIDDGTLRPVLGPSSVARLTTRAFYPDDDPLLEALGLSGQPHGQSRGGVGADIGTLGNNFPIVLTQPESLLTQDSSLLFTPGGGLTAVTHMNDFTFRYAHMQDNTFAYNQLNDLLNYAQNSGLFRVPLPPGYQIGNVGNTGNLSTGPHLHWEWIPRWGP